MKNVPRSETLLLMYTWRLISPRKKAGIGFIIRLRPGVLDPKTFARELADIFRFVWMNGARFAPSHGARILNVACVRTENLRG